MTSDRRSFLASLGAAGILSACAGSHNIVPGLPGSESPDRHRVRAGSTMPLTIVNKTGYADKDIWFYVVGQPQAGGDFPWVHLLGPGGATKNCVASDAKNGIADYSLQLSDIPNGLIQLPSLHGGRMYFSIKDKLKIPLGTGANPVPGSPPGWVGPDPNYNILFDNWEFTLVADDPTTGFNFNATQVDMLGIPMSVRGIGKDEQDNPIDRTIGFGAGARTKIFSAMRAATGYDKLVITGALGDLRVIAPNLGIDPVSGRDGKTPLFAKDYLDAYVASLWTYYANHTLRAKTSQGVYMGSVKSNGFFAFEMAGKPTIYFRKPTTREVFECNMQPFCGDVNTKCPLSDLGAIEIKGALPAAMNRASLPSTELGIVPGEDACVDSLAKAYKTKPCNEYSRIMHQFGLNGKAYGFGNDDVCAGSSYVAIRKPQKAVVTLLPFK